MPHALPLDHLQTALAQFAQRVSPNSQVPLRFPPASLANFLRSLLPKDQDPAVTPPDSQEASEAAELDSQEQNLISSMLDRLTPEQVKDLAAAAQTLHPQGSELVRSLVPLNLNAP